MVARLLVRYPRLVEKWAGSRDFSAEAAGFGAGAGHTPWTRLAKPVRAACVGLVTTGGVHLKTQTPFDMSNPDGDPTFREIPADTEPAALAITHDYYDFRDAQADVNIVLPLERLRELAAEGAIGAVAPVHMSFMGHVDNELVERLIGETAPAAARRMREAGADAVLLAPV